MKISDRDKKLILFVLLVAIIALPIFLFIRPTSQKTKEAIAENDSLAERYEYLKKLFDKKAEYEQEIVRLNGERDNMIKDYAGGILKENTIMFLSNIERSEKPVEMWGIVFSDTENTEITEASVVDGQYVEGLTAIHDKASVLYKAEYPNMKEFINYIFTYKDKMNLTAMTIELDETTNLVMGTFELDQYAISGNGKTVTPVTVPGLMNGVTRLFNIIYDEQGNPVTPESALGIKSEPQEEPEETGEDTTD